MKLVKTVKNASAIYSLEVLVKDIYNQHNNVFKRLLLNPIEVGKMKPIAWVVHCALHY